MENAICLVELDEVLSMLLKEDFEKIPEDIRIAIKNGKDKTYTWKYDKSKDLRNQNLNRKTIAMLAYLNMEYLVNEEQKALLQQIHSFNEKKLENEKQIKYNSDNLFKDKKAEQVVDVKNEVALIEIKKEKGYKKIYLFLKSKIKK